MGNFFDDNEDLKFQFEKGVDWPTLVEVTEFGYTTKDGFKSPEPAREFYREVVRQIGSLAADVVAPRSVKLDREEAILVDGETVEPEATQAIFEALRQAECHRLCVPRELGGLNAPMITYFTGAELIARGDVATMTHFSFHEGMALAALAFSLNEGSTEYDKAQCAIGKTRFADVIQEISSGAAFGSMDITEPDAGSDMAQLKAKGEQDENGNWFITGQKIFITSGHAKYHYVIARTEAAKDGDAFAGLSGLSMFLVKAYEDVPGRGRVRHVTVDRIEEKLGHHGSVTAALSFDRAPAQLIGRRGEGFKYMLVLMNNARLGVGYEGIGLMESAYRMATAYAAERRSMGKTLDRHEMIADMLDEMRTDIQGLRALAFRASVHEELSQKLQFAQRLGITVPNMDELRIASELKRHRRLARRYTPLLKYLSAEKAVETARRNLQIHGGAGYMREYGAEKLLRDSLVLPIYEGTSQIQSLMAMKDVLSGITRAPKSFATRLARARWRAAARGDVLGRRVAKLQVASLSAQQFLITRTAASKLKTLAGVPVAQWKDQLTKNWDPKRDFALAMLHAERLTKLLADEAIAEILLEQARAFPERRDVLERWLDRAEVRAHALTHEITTTGGRILSSLADAQAKAVG
jgi:alkylation response protein AidB-like acyl-CoA dehydrogenase